MRFSILSVTIILAAICAVGAMAIPFGDPRLIGGAIALETFFIILTLLAYKGFRKVLYVCIPLALIVILGNSLAPPHVHIMTTFSKPLNAILLIIGGYILQSALIGSSVYELFKVRKQSILPKTKKAN
jgi:predicted branched-subunit amino acid permease